MSDKTILERFMPFKKALLVWASPKMIETWDRAMVKFRVRWVDHQAAFLF